MKSYENFKKEIKEKLLAYMPEEYKAIEFIRNARGLEAVAVGKGYDDGAIMMDIKPYFKLYMQGTDIRTVIKRLADSCEKNIIAKEEFENKFGAFDRYENVKDKIMFEVRSVKSQREYLGILANQTVGDMVKLYYVPSGKTGRAFITKKLVEEWEMSVEKLDSVAVCNTAKQKPYRNYEGTLGSRIITNSDFENGAGAIFYPEVMDKIAEDLGEPFYIIPASIDEAFVFTKGEFKNDGIKALAFAVRRANEEIIPRELRLSDKVYEYDKDTKKIIEAAGLSSRTKECER